MKVLHVTATMSPEGGGPPVVVGGLASALSVGGVPCEIATTTAGRFRRPPIAVPRAPLHAFSASLLSRVWNAHSPMLADYVGRRLSHFDVVHVHELWHYPAFAACRAAREHGIPYVVSLHGGLGGPALRQKAARKWWYMKLVQRHILGSAAALHALTDVEAAQARRLGVTTRVAVIPNAVEADLPAAIDQADAAAFRERFAQLDGRRVILFLGRLAERKGLDVLAASFIRVAGRFPDAALLVAGPNEGNMQAETTRTLAAAGLDDRVVFAGTLQGPDKLAALTCADVFVLPSRSEGFSNAVLEAMAAGLPVVISEHCNFPEVADHGAGLVVGTDVNEVADAVCGLLGDDQRRVEAGRNGRRLVEERYCWPTIAQAFAELYESVAA